MRSYGTTKWGRVLEMRVPPLVVLVATSGLVWASAALTPEWTTDQRQTTRKLAAAALALVGLGVAMAGVWEFRKHGTTVNPMRPKASLTIVESGIYRWTRNPMYLGMHLGLVGLAVLCGNLWGMVAAHAFVAYITRFQIAPEERALAERFGEPYANYRGRVRRWVGRGQSAT